VNAAASFNFCIQIQLLLAMKDVLTFVGQATQTLHSESHTYFMKEIGFQFPIFTGI